MEDLLIYIDPELDAFYSSYSTYQLSLYTACYEPKTDTYQVYELHREVALGTATCRSSLLGRREQVLTPVTK